MSQEQQSVPQQRQPLLVRLRAYIPAEGQEGLAIRDALLREAADEIDRLRREIIDMDKEHRAELREAMAEAAWKTRQGEDYGSF